MSEGPNVTLSGSLETDGSIVYIGGMDLANILRASIPNWSRAGGHAYQADHGHVCITIRPIDPPKP